MKKPLIVAVSLFSLGLGGAGAWYAKAKIDEKKGADQTAQSLADAAQTVPVTFVVTPPEGTPTDQRLYLSGSTATLGSWEAAGVPMTLQDDGTYATTIDLVNSVEYQYKVTRGTWSTVEQAAGDQPLPDRVVKVEPEPAATVAIAVAEWVDKGLSNPSVTTRTGDIRFHKALPFDGLELPRDLVVWLPPGYDTATDRRYPVLYVQDAQNLFDAAESYQGFEWRLDETARDLVLSGDTQPMIIVGLGNTDQRPEEFTPGTAKSKAYVDFVVTAAKPLIDSTYRTKAGTNHTSIAGAGMGAVISFYIVDSRPGVFGKVVALAPTQWGVEPEMLEEITWNGSAWSDVRAWIDHAELGEQMKAAGLDEVRISPAEEGHNEDDWAEVAPDFLRFLFPPIDNGQLAGG
ncbi:MAG: alpha/beta hydrolase-fold protein [Planctomycetota bacterium]